MIIKTINLLLAYIIIYTVYKEFTKFNYRTQQLYIFLGGIIVILYAIEFITLFIN